MSGALWLLIGLQVRGWLRSLGRGLRTPKGLALAALGLFVFVPWAASVLLTPASPNFDPEALRRAGPAALLGYCLLNVLLTAGEGALYFSPAEVSFLFPAPLGRRQLLTYKVAGTVLTGLPTALFVTLFFRAYAGSFASAFVAIGLVYLFLQLFAMAVQMFVTAVGVTVFRRGRTAILAVVVIAAASWAALGGTGAVAWLGDRFGRFGETPAWRAVTQPLSWFVEAFLADSPAALARYAALAAGVNAALLGLVYLLDANHLEASALASARAYARLQRLRGRDVPDEVAGGGRGVRFGLPPLPRLGGVGPVLWRQLTTALRNPLRLITLAVPVALVLAGVATGPERDEPEAVLLVPVLVGSVLLLPTLLANVVPFDFRGDVDRMAALKALPLSAWRLTLGQVAAPVIVVSGVQWLALTVLGRLLQSDDASLAAAAALAVPINFLVFGVENLLFLLFPTRLHGGTPGDFQALGRSVLLLAARVVVLGAAAVAAGAAAFVLLLVTGSAAAALGAAWLVLAAAGAVVVPFVALAFEAFDVARDVPA